MNNHLHFIGDISFWTGYLQEKSSKELLVKHTFQKQSALSQCDIVTANGRLKLSVPTVKSTRKGYYEQVEIDYKTNWQIEHWRSIENAYLKSPFFLYYGYKIESVFMSKPQYLVEYNYSLYKVICKCLKIETGSLNLEQDSIFQKIPNTLFEHKKYPQVFDSKLAFESNLSILDVLFNLGPETKDFLLSL